MYDNHKTFPSDLKNAQDFWFATGQSEAAGEQRSR